MSVLSVVQLARAPGNGCRVGKMHRVFLGKRRIAVRGYNGEGRAQSLVRCGKPAVGGACIKVRAFAQHKVAAAGFGADHAVRYGGTVRRQVGQPAGRRAVRQKDGEKDGHLVGAVRDPLGSAAVFGVTCVPQPVMRGGVMPAGSAALAAGVGEQPIVGNGHGFALAAVAIHAAAVGHAGIGC